MAGINFIGSYSGIDGSMIDQLMEVTNSYMLTASHVCKEHGVIV